MSGSLVEQITHPPARAGIDIVFQTDVLHQVINQFINAVYIAFQVVQASGGGVTLLVVC